MITVYSSVHVCVYMCVYVDCVCLTPSFPNYIAALGAIGIIVLTGTFTIHCC